jgi:type I restriction enzyme R subunit
MANSVNTEDGLAEQPAIEWLEEFGWSYAHGAEISPNGVAPERDSYTEVLLKGRLAAGIRRLNPELSEAAVVKVIADVAQAASTTPIDDHAAFHDLLLDGVSVEWRGADGKERSKKAFLVDFKNPAANDLLVVNQFRIEHGKQGRRPDLLLFVNGIPLGLIELKHPGDPLATPEGAINQIKTYVDHLPQLFRFVEFVSVSDLINARAGTITCEPEHFAPWRSMDPADDEGKSALEVMLRGMYAPERFLDIIESFTVFLGRSGPTIKVLAKYHQYDAANKAVEGVKRAATDRKKSQGRAGVVWHTTGAGKSLAMVFFTQKIRRDPSLRNPTIVALTDRLDLDQQLYDQFAAHRTLGTVVKRAESIRGSSDGLVELLRDTPAGGVIFTTIQKFQAEDKTKPMGVLSNRDNIIVMADEAHRSQYAQYAGNLAEALPHALRIGFTGTPIETADRSTRLAFGDYISTYTISRAIEDGATVPIYYESRRAPIKLADEDLLKEAQDALENVSEDDRKKLETSWSQLARVVGAPDRLDRVCADLVKHYTARQEVIEGKALVACMTREICAEMTKRLKKALGDEAVTCVMSTSPTDSDVIRGPNSEYVRSKQAMDDVAAKFRDPDSALKIVVVRDMWLTGFDVPCLHTLYVDKPMRDHGLLQAIARVNRVFKDKPGGLVVDYIGIGEDLRSSLRAYDEQTQEEAAFDLATAAKKLQEKHEILVGMFTGIDRDAVTDPKKPAKDRATTIFVAHNKMIVDEETKLSFLKEQALFERWYKLVHPNEPARKYARDRAFFATISGSIRKLDGTSTPESDKSAEQALKQFFSEGLAADAIVDVLVLAADKRTEISLLSDEFVKSIEKNVPGESLRVAIFKRLLADQIRVRMNSNALQAKLFTERVNELLARYELRQLTSEAVIKALVEMAHEMQQIADRAVELGLTDEEIAFYDALAGGTPEAAAADPKLASLAHKLTEALRKDLSVDWADRESTRAAIRAKVKRLLRNEAYTPPQTIRGSGGGVVDPRELNAIVDMILQQAEVLYANWPDSPVVGA